MSAEAKLVAEGGVDVVEMTGDLHAGSSVTASIP
jgi:hypothetical protein